MSLPVEEQRQARAVRELIRAAGGTEPAAADISKSQTQVSRYQSEREPDSITLRDIEILEGITHGKAGHPIVTRYLAQRAGCALFHLPTVHATGADLLHLVGEQARESGRITSTVIDALEDGRIDRDETRRIRADIARLIDAAVAMDAEMAAYEEGLA